jgi:hypothetical protein
MSVIKKGYRITVVSWENDGDYYNTKSKEGLSKEWAHAICDILKEVFTSELSNSYEPDSDVIGSTEMHEILKGMFNEHVYVTATRKGFEVSEYDHD